MQSLNRIFLMGYLGNNPELYTTKSGKQFTGLSVAINRSTYTGEDGEDGKPIKQSTTEWHYVKAWGKQADTCHKYLKIGAPVFIEGYVTQYQLKKEGKEPERTTGINAISVKFLPRAIQSTNMRDDHGEVRPELHEPPEQSMLN
jgi:single-strand DNA-binding protein